MNRRESQSDIWLFLWLSRYSKCLENFGVWGRAPSSQFYVQIRRAFSLSEKRDERDALWMSCLFCQTKCTIPSRRNMITTKKMTTRSVFVRLNARFFCSSCSYSDKRAFTMTIDLFFRKKPMMDATAKSPD